MTPRRRETTGDSYAGIRLEYNQAINDVKQMMALSHAFLLPESVRALKDLSEFIASARNGASERPFHLSIPLARPIKTKSTTAYRSSDKGQAIPVYGSLSFMWEVINPDKGRRTQSAFTIVGIATTLIEIYTDDAVRVARWQFEMGDVDSPGCHFHASANQQDLRGELFPKWLKIPRLPGLLFSPMDGLEFLLGELFQSEWE